MPLSWPLWVRAGGLQAGAVFSLAKLQTVAPFAPSCPQTAGRRAVLRLPSLRLSLQPASNEGLPHSQVQAAALAPCIAHVLLLAQTPPKTGISGQSQARWMSVCSVQMDVLMWLPMPFRCLLLLCLSWKHLTPYGIPGTDCLPVVVFFPWLLPAPTRPSASQRSQNLPLGWSALSSCIISGRAWLSPLISQEDSLWPRQMEGFQQAAMAPSPWIKFPFNHMSLKSTVQREKKPEDMEHTPMWPFSRRSAQV